MALEDLASGTPVAVVPVPGQGTALAWDGGSVVVPTVPPAPVRWTWWSARDVVPHLGFRPDRCWDLGAVGQLLHGLRRDDAAAVWAAAHALPEPPAPDRPPDLLDLGGEGDEPVRADGQLSREWLRDGAGRDAGSACEWAGLALRVQAAQEERVRALPELRRAPTASSLGLLTARAESAAALLAAELEQEGLPLDVGVVGEMLGPRPASAAEESALRARLDGEVLRHFEGSAVDLRSPGQVRELLTRIGLDVPDTRSWRLEPYAASMPAVAALLAWRKAERVRTTYGWRWLDEHVGADGRLRGAWRSADGGAGRMTASAGLHNLPAEMRPSVRAEPGFTMVRADLGQIEPRVLAVVSGDRGLAAAAARPDMYEPVAAALRCDRPTAKVAVLAAMYGQTSGTAGAALRDMERAYPVALAYLRAAEQAGMRRADLRTYGGRLLPLSRLPVAPPGAPIGEFEPAASGYGRFARNAMIQGAAAELFKAWAATVRAALEPLGGRIVLCLHDELLLHVPESAAGDAERVVVDALERTARWWAAGSTVRFVADVSTGPDWAAAH